MIICISFTVSKSHEKDHNQQWIKPIKLFFCVDKPYTYLISLYHRPFNVFEILQDTSMSYTCTKNTAISLCCQSHIFY